MVKIKKYIILVISMIFCSFMTFTGNAAEDSLRNIQNVKRIDVEEKSLKSKIKEHDIPAEVAEYVENVFEDDKNADVVIYAPLSEISTFSGTGAWGSTRTYQGHILQDWNVTVTNAFEMTSIKSGSMAYAFADSMSAYVGGVLLDRVIPFGSAGVTLAQFIYGNGTTVYASDGDKASAAPKYTSVTRFTYVDGKEQLGARTQQVNLESIMWYYYNDKNHLQEQGKKEYNKLISTPSYKNPDPKAISGVASGGYIESPITFRIGDKDFVLE